MNDLDVTRRLLLAGIAATPASAIAATTAGAMTIVTLGHADGRSTRFRLMTPDRAGKWPVVLFSHGANSTSASYDRLWTIWAARGYAVIGPDHIDSGPIAQQAKPPPAGLWTTRVADLVLPLDQRRRFDQLATGRGGLLDWSAVVAAGHSFGAVVAQGLAGARLIDPVSHARADARRPEVGACLTFSPPGPLPGFVPDDAWAPVRVPALLQTGTADVLPGFVDDWQRRLTGFAGAPDRWTFVGHGVDHYFGGLICRLHDGGEVQRPALDEAAMLSATFLDAYLRHDPQAVRRLTTRKGDDGVATFDAATVQPSAGNVGLVPRRVMLHGAIALALAPVARRALAAIAAPAPALPVSDSIAIIGRTPPAPVEPWRHGKTVTAAALDAAQRFSDGFGGTALLVAVDGRLVHETYAPGFTATTRLKTYSMAKSVLGIAYGLGIEHGVVALDDPLGRHVDELRGDPRGEILLRQLLQMRSGLKLDSLFRRDPKAIELVLGRNVTGTALTTALIGTPGETFEYNNVNSFLAGLALDRALRRAGRGPYAEFLSRELWRPLGQADATLDVEFAPAGEPRFFAGLDATGRDWLRIGSLFIDHGRAVGRTIVPAAWLATMTTPSPNPNYGLQMWLGQPWTPQRRYSPNTSSMVPCAEPYAAADLVFFDGSGGQRVYMIQSRRVVIVRTGAASPKWEDSLLPNTIIRGLT